MSTLPPAIWLHIASFLPPKSILTLLPLNSVFFNLAMDLRYSQISFSYLTKNMRILLQRLKDEEVRKRVKILWLYPGFLKELEVEEQEKEYTLLGKIAGKVKRCHRKLIPTIIRTLSSLPNLDEYHLSWSGLPTLDNVVVLLVVLAPLTQSAKLKKLCLDISVEKLGALVDVASTSSSLGFLPPLPTLTHLDIFFRTDNVLCKEEYARILTRFGESFAVHSESTSTDSCKASAAFSPRTLKIPNLTTLKIQSFSSLDLSPFFSSLSSLIPALPDPIHPTSRSPTFPLLAEVILNIPINYPYLGNPSSVREFLHLHGRSLKKLSVRGNDLGRYGSGYDYSCVCGYNCLRPLNPPPYSYGCNDDHPHSFSTWLIQALIPCLSSTLSSESPNGKTPATTVLAPHGIESELKLESLETLELTLTFLPVFAIFSLVGAYSDKSVFTDNDTSPSDDRTHATTPRVVLNGSLRGRGPGCGWESRSGSTTSISSSYSSSSVLSSSESSSNTFSPSTSSLSGGLPVFSSVSLAWDEVKALQSPLMFVHPDEDEDEDEDEEVEEVKGRGKEKITILEALALGPP